MMKARLSGRERVMFAIIIAIGILLRVAVLIPFSMNHPDEVFQYLEPAHRMVFGNGVVTWEFRYGMRGWLLPTLLSWLMELGAYVAPETGSYLLFPRLAASLASLSIPISAFFIGLRMSRSHAFIAMTVLTLWFETIYFSAHTLSEEIALILFMPAAALMLSENRNEKIRFFLAGFLLGFAVSIRFHYAPAFAVLGTMCCGKDVRNHWLPLMSGGILAIALAGIVDIAHGSAPFSWVLINFSQNIVKDRAAAYGTASPVFYLASLATQWLWMFPFIALAIRPSIPRNNALFLVAIANLLILSFVGHKEYRFILLSTTILVLLAALGSVEWIKFWATRFQWQSWSRLMVFLVLFWATASTTLAITGTARPMWTVGSPQLTLARKAADLPGLCGMAIHHLPFWKTGGYTYLHRPVPLYLTYVDPEVRTTSADMALASRSFNAIIAPQAFLKDVPEQFRKSACEGDGNQRTCLMVRSGGCDPRPGAYWEMQTTLLRYDY